MKTNSSLTYLNLETRHKLDHISLSHSYWYTENEIEDEGAKAIGEALKTNTSLTKLNLSI